MATTYHILTTVKSGSNHLDTTTTAPTSMSAAAGWVSNTTGTFPLYNLMDSGANRAAVNATSSVLPDDTTGPDNTIGDCVVIGPLTASIASIDLALQFQKTAASSTFELGMSFRVWRASSVTGASATLLTESVCSTDTHTVGTSTYYNFRLYGAATINAELDNEYLFVQLAQTQVTASSSQTSTFLQRSPATPGYSAVTLNTAETVSGAGTAAGSSTTSATGSTRPDGEPTTNKKYFLLQGLVDGFPAMSTTDPGVTTNAVAAWDTTSATANYFAPMVAGGTSSTWAAAVFPATTDTPGSGNAFRTPQIFGTFEGGTWDLAVAVKATSGMGNNVKCTFTLVRSTSSTGASGNTTVSTSTAYTNQLNLYNTTVAIAELSIELPNVVLDGEYLFLLVGMQYISLGGGADTIGIIERSDGFVATPVLYIDGIVGGAGSSSGSASASATGGTVPPATRFYGGRDPDTYVPVFLSTPPGTGSTMLQAYTTTDADTGEYALLTYGAEDTYTTAVKPSEAVPPQSSYDLGYANAVRCGPFSEAIPATGWRLTLVVAGDGLTSIGQVQFSAWRSASVEGDNATLLTARPRVSDLVRPGNDAFMVICPFELDAPVNLQGEYLFVQIAWRLYTDETATDNFVQIITDDSGRETRLDIPRQSIGAGNGVGSADGTSRATAQGARRALIYPLNAKASGTEHRSAQIAGTIPTSATGSTGWTMGTTVINRYALADSLTERAATNFSATVYPDGTAPNNTLGDCIVIGPLSGFFGTEASWTIAFGVRAVTNASSGSGAMMARVWKGSNITGSGATQLTSGALTGTTMSSTFSRTATRTTTVTWTPGVPVVLNNEYLFIQYAWKITTASTNTSADCLIRIGDTSIITPPQFIGIPAMIGDGPGGVATATGAGAALIGTVGSAAGTSTATAAGDYELAGFTVTTGAAAGAATASGAAEAATTTAGTSAGVATVYGEGSTKAGEALYLWFTKNKAAGSEHLAMVAGDAPANETTTTGLTIGTTAAGKHAVFDSGTLRTTAAFGDTVLPDTSGPNGALGDCFVAGPYTGRFMPGPWKVVWELQTQSATDGAGLPSFRIWKGPDITGAGAVEVTRNRKIAFIDPCDLDGYNIWGYESTHIYTGVDLNNEYIFVQVAWEITTASSSTTAKIYHRVGRSQLQTPELYSPKATGETEIDLKRRYTPTHTEQPGSNFIATNFEGYKLPALLYYGSCLTTWLTGLLDVSPVDPLFSSMEAGAARQTSTFADTVLPDTLTAPDNTIGDCFVAGPLSTTLTTSDLITIRLSYGASYETHWGAMRMKVWKSASVTGTSPTLVMDTISTTEAFIATYGASYDTQSGYAENVELDNEYLFVQIAFLLGSTQENALSSVSIVYSEGYTYIDIPRAWETRGAAGTAAGTATASATNIETAAGVGAAAGTSTAAAVGVQSREAVATASATGAAAGVLSATSAAVAQAIATATANAVVASVTSGVASSTGTGTVAGVLAATGVMTASAVGQAAAQATLAGTASMAATAAGTATAVGVTTAIHAAVASAVAEAIAAAVGRAQIGCIGTATAVATATAEGRAVSSTVGTSAGEATANGATGGYIPREGTAQGTSIAAGVLAATAAATGSASGTAVASASFVALVLATGDSSASSEAAGQLAATAAFTGTSAAQATALARGVQSFGIAPLVPPFSEWVSVLTSTPVVTVLAADEIVPALTVTAVATATATTDTAGVMCVEATVVVYNDTAGADVAP